MRIIFFIIFFLSFDLAADELLKPSYLLKPDQVIAIQLTALKNNDQTLNEINQGVQSQTLNQNTAAELDSLFQSLKKEYNTGLQEIIGPNFEQNQGKLISRIKNQMHLKI